MSKKLLLGILIVTILAVVSAYGTYAWFTSVATSQQNTFTTGTLSITGSGEIMAGLEIGNIFPSWWDSKTVTVTNNGTLPFKYSVHVNPLVGNYLYEGPTPLKVKISKTVNGANTLIKDFTNINELGEVDLGTLNPAEGNQSGNNQQLTFEFKLPQEADNAYQNVSGNFTFAFNAEQIQMP